MIPEILGAIIAALVVYHINWQRSAFVKKINMLPGPRVLPFFGNALGLLRSPVDLYTWVITELAPIGPAIRIWFFGTAQVGIRGARDLEPILKNMTHISKSENYKYLREWLGHGIIPTTGERWRTYRKVLTPAFHFNILHEFLPIFNKHSTTLVKCLAADENPQGFDIFKYTTLCSFDIICESSMGARVDAQLNKDSPYVTTTLRVVDLFSARYISPLLRFDFIWKFSPQKREMDKKCKYIYDFSVKVLRERREYLKSISNNQNNEEEENVYCKKHNMVFLDLLLAAEEKFPQHLSEDDMIYNVNNFMFAGFETIGTTTGWVLYLLGLHPEIQDRVVDELQDVFGDSGREPDVADLSNLKLLERCMKESLRLYPTIPFIERSINQDEQLEVYEIPSGCIATVNLYSLHRDPEFFKNPHTFDPDRFLPENSSGRHPYTYIPFSAGPRNCIGQKYAMLEGKAMLSTILRRLKVVSMQSREDLKLRIGMVLRPEGGLYLKVFERTSHPKLRVIDN